MKTITIYTNLPITEQEQIIIRKMYKKKANIVFLPHDHSVIEYIEHKEIEPKNVQELMEMI